MLQCVHSSTWPHFVHSIDDEYPRRLMNRIVCSRRSRRVVHRVDESSAKARQRALLHRLDAHVHNVDKRKLARIDALASAAAADICLPRRS